MATNMKTDFIDHLRISHNAPRLEAITYRYFYFLLRSGTLSWSTRMIGLRSRCIMGYAQMVYCELDWWIDGKKSRM